ncbi:hypothetical protein OGV95_09635 [Citrobacter sp. Cf236]|uniref:hypothetical protein n=1 Tax=Citrobacter sp. Cf236 TaxID=2985088 RepID=UPI00257850A2|nr:hypothetical protein [Citrobacter sp. Cf236]MDM3055371.1 hypothetical protein [Citrobacter sp. Cf236]
MAFESIAAAQECRESLGIKGKTYTTVEGYVDGDLYTVTVSSDHDKVEFIFEYPVYGFKHFHTRFQSMEWDEEQFILTISSTNPSYSFEIHFKEQ